MMRTGILEMRGAKLIVAVACVLLLAAVQVAVQAKPAQAYEVRIAVKGGGTVDETTAANLAYCSQPSTTSNDTSLTCLAGTPTGDYGYLWDVDYTATPAPGFSFVRWESDGTSRSAVICDRSSPAATTSTYTGNICKFRTPDNLQTRAVFADTTDPPQPSVSGPTSVVSQSATFFFSITSDPTFKQFECRINTFGSSFQTCSSGNSVNVSNLADGNYTYQVRARDYSDRLSPIGTASFTLDNTAPNTTITSGPAHDSTTQNRNPSFSYRSTEMGTFECNLTGPGLTSTVFSFCPPSTLSDTGTINYSNLRDGTYTFKVRARDRAGNTDTNYLDSTRTWTINNPPTVLDNTLTPAKGATGVSRTTGVSATFSEEMSATSLREADNTSRTFKLQQYNKKTRKWKTIPATIALSLAGGKTVATLDPHGATEGTGEQPLSANKKFRGMITTGAKDLDSNPLARTFVWTFNTGSVVG